VVEVLSLDEFSRGAAIAAKWTQDTISAETREFLLSLSPQGEGEGIGLFHASPRDPVWEYVLSGLTAELCFDATDFRVSMIGHSHVALSFHRPEGQPASGTTRREGTELDLSTGEWLVNPGSTGQPRDGDPRAAWLMLDTDRQTAVYRRAPPGSCSTPTARRPSTAARSTTSPARRPRSARPGCPIRSPNGCSTANDVHLAPLACPG
jgi:diadenosine tetraphosphatase ApaH/serine/threonine PP2A family protein phosphatase